MKLVIDRSKWIRGEKLDSYLRRGRDEKMCCLGFFGIACGFAPAELAGSQEPREVAQYGKWPDWMVVDRGYDEEDNWFADWQDSDDAGDLIAANDDDEIEDAERERLIAQAFAKHDVEVEFVDEVTP